MAPAAPRAMPTDVLRELREALGDAAVREHEPVALDGMSADVTLAPAGPDDLAAALALCSRRALPLWVRGGASRLAVGNRPSAAGAWLATGALDPDCEVDGDEGVARVSAATSVAALDAAARRAGWRAPLEAPDSRATVGGALSSAAVGPRALGLGPARRTVLGLDVALASGERTRCGSRVVKNVSGYDLAKLYVGSRGTLGVLTAGWLRLRPAPEAERTLAARPGARGLALARAAARRPGARAVAWVDGALASAAPALADAAPGGGDLLLVDLAGDAPVVEDAAAWLAGEAEVVDAPGAVEALATLEGDAATAALRFRLAAPPSALPGLWERLRAAGARPIAHPGLSAAFAFFDLEREDATLVDDAWRAVHGATDPAAGIHAVLEQAPDWAKDGRDVFGAPPATLPLMRALKARFDPAGILNPGRFAGGL